MGLIVGLIGLVAISAVSSFACWNLCRLLSEANSCIRSLEPSAERWRWVVANPRLSIALLKDRPSHEWGYWIDCGINGEMDEDDVNLSRDTMGKE